MERSPPAAKELLFIGTYAADTNSITLNCNPLCLFKDHPFFRYNWDKVISGLSPVADFSAWGLKAQMCYHKEHLTGSPKLWRYREIHISWWKLSLQRYSLLLRLLSWESLSIQRNLAHKLHDQISNINKPLFPQKHFICYKRQEFKHTLTKLRNSYEINKH